jgi:DNA-binding MarR family transcriptional regulator
MSDAPPLTELELAAWKGLHRAQAHLRRELEARLTEVGGGLGIGEYDVLIALSQAPGRASRMSDLAERMVMTSGGFTRLVDRLVRAGYVSRQRCPDDGRGSLAVLTDEGAGLIERLVPARAEQVRRLFLDHLDAEDVRRMAAAWERIAGPEAEGAPSGCGAAEDACGAATDAGAKDVVVEAGRLRVPAAKG